MLSIIKSQVVSYYRVWTTLPDVVNLTLVKPIAPVQPEAYKVDYTEDQLRNLVIGRTDLFGNMVIDAAAVRSLPADYMTDMYHGLRYLKPTTVTIPLRLSDKFSTSPYLLPNYILASALLAAIYEKESKTVDPVQRWQANNLLKLIKQLHYVLANIIKANPSGAKPNQTVVSSYFEEVGTGEELISTRYVFIDQNKLTELQSSGWTADSIAEHWANTGTQPA